METVIEKPSLSQYYDFILDEATGRLEEDYSSKIGAIEQYLEKKSSLVLSVTFENCLRFNISPVFIYLLDGLIEELKIMQIYEIILMYKLGNYSYEGFVNLLYLVVMSDYSESKIAKEMAANLGFVFTKRSLKKNSLFRINDGLYGLEPFPVLDSSTSLSKEYFSEKYIPSRLTNDRIEKVCKGTVISLLTRLESSTSSRVILMSLDKYFSLYEEEQSLYIALSKLPKDVLFTTPKMLVNLRKLVVLLKSYLIGDKTVLGQILKTIELI